MVLSRGLGLLLRGCAALVGLALCAYVSHVVFGLGGEGLDGFFNSVVYNGLLLAGACACLARAALIAEERMAWLVMGLGILAWTGGEIYYTVVYSGVVLPPFPSPSDALYLAFYPASYVTLVMLLRRRIAGVQASACLDAAIGGLAVASLVAAVAFGPILEATSGDVAAVAVTLAYPIADLVLLALVVAVVGLSGWRLARAWVLIGLGLIAMAAADVVYLVQAAQGTYVEGTPLDLLWPACALLVGFGAWQRAAVRARPELERTRVIAVPLVAAVSAIALLVYDHFDRLSAAALFLTVATLLAVTGRMALAFTENQRMLQRTTREARTDALTGLGNRRCLMADLDAELAAAANGDERALILFDLNGFKQYNDAFGHPAGDSLLARLGGRLDAAVRPFGHAYRLGGDEFCALVRLGPAGLDSVVAGAATALAEQGDGFQVSSAYGVVTAPHETTDPSEALQLADRRMYARKGGRQGSAGRQTRDVLLSTLREREPDLHEHLRDVAKLSLAVGRGLGIGPEALDELARAAELHDVGKMAIPDAILSKPGPLDESEWEFMRRHTIIGERILGAAPALRPVGKIVRSSHERWDGAGYPDGLAGEDIPLGARIVCVCDAFHAMTTGRSYCSPVSSEEALAELRRCAGSQFDAAAVDSLVAVVAGELSLRPA